MSNSILQKWLSRHFQVALQSLGRVSRNPIASWMTITVIAIALALPAGLYLITDNLQRLGTIWDGDATLSLYLNTDLEKETTELAELLHTWEEIDDVRVISAEQGLANFREQSGLGKALEILDNNPLPDVIVVHPNSGLNDELSLKKLMRQLNALPGVEITQMDLDWVKRFNAIVNLGRTAITLISGLLAAGVLLIIGNTIRLEIQNRKDEIEITQLVGGTTGFIQRPFLYTGFWYGLLGGILAWLLVGILYWSLLSPVKRLTGLYESQFSLGGLGISESLLLLAIASLLGLCGSWLAASYHLYRGNDLSQYY